MNEHFRDIVLRATGATDLFEVNKIQDLWSGYGVIMRYGLKESHLKTVVVKHVRLPTGTILIRYGWVDEFLEGFEVEAGQDRVDKLVEEVTREFASN